MARLVIELLRPYRGWLTIVFIAMLVEIGTGLAAPWPLKLVIDDALGNHHLPHWLEWAQLWLWQAYAQCCLATGEACHRNLLEHVVRRLVETARHDWERSRKLPLSDDAVLADLQGRGLNEVSRLPLGGFAAAGVSGLNRRRVARRNQAFAIHSTPGISVCPTRRLMNSTRKSRTASPAVVRGRSAK